MTMLPALWASAATAATPALRLLLRQRVRRGKEIAERLAEREGREESPRPAGRLVWLHAASIGESVSVLPVISEIVLGDPGVTVLVTTGTVTSATLLTRRLPEMGLAQRVIHRFAPLDVPRWVARFLDHWRPDVAALVESEIWPNLLVACRCRHIPMVLLNGRMSERSFARWSRAPSFAREILGCFTVMQAQSDGDAEKFRALGVRGVEVPGNLKFSAPELPVVAGELARCMAWLGDRPRWLAASTHPGEEEVIADAHRALVRDHPGLVTIIAPRHPDRGGRIAGGLGDVAVTRRALDQPPPDEGIWLADTLGEMGLWYRLAGIAFVGRSLIPPGGGQNPLEAARLGCTVAVGPYTGNFKEPVEKLRIVGGLSVSHDVRSIAEWADQMLRDRGVRETAGVAGASLALQQGDLPRRIATMLLESVQHD
ncbi:MAG: 3-deoxy-D-manno-octulosonic acid transferase [Acetobacteraceae bacterium]